MGVRRCGKYFIMQLICNELIENGMSKMTIRYDEVGSKKVRVKSLFN